MRLVAFGCSYTYGMGLDDCYLPDQPWEILPGRPGPFPSKKAWPALLSQKLNLECRNLAAAGISNKTILYNILNTKFRETDSVVIMWTFFSRVSLIVDKGCREYSIWRISDKDSMTYYDKFYNDENATFDSYAYINFAESFLKNKVSKVIHTKVLYDIREDQEYKISKAPRWNEVDIALSMDEYTQYPKALDGIHPGTEAHKQFTERLFNYMENK